MSACKKKMRLMMKYSLCLLLLSAGLFSTTGCATVGADRTPPPPPDPVVTPPQPPVTPEPVPTVVEQEGLYGSYASFGQLRTVIRANERVRDQQGREVKADEMASQLERELVLRNFRLFNQVMAAPTDIAEISRRTHAHLVIDLDARSEFVNTTGRFSRYRAEADVRAVRPADGTILVSRRAEEMGPRNQNPDRAGRLALRALAESVSEQLVQDLFDKANQLRWFGLSITPVATHNQAAQIRQTLARQANVEYVELLAWDRDTQTAKFEIVHGLQHESDIPALLRQVPGLRARPTEAGGGDMQIFRNRLTHYK